ncbi:MAG: efflux RND transporter periplasmic adaptor subunit, partial [Planctomycetes bacterium]|nr:efflux RND transporter periplasmic adaptor subunit [Planctomycetota bacterium]
MSIRIQHIDRRWVVITIATLVVAVGWATYGHWGPAAKRQVATISSRIANRGATGAGADSAKHEQLGSAHSHEGHDHAGHEETSVIELSAQARKNIGLKTAKVKLSTFMRTIPVPGIVVERHGRTKSRVVAPLTGIVTRVHVIEGEAVEPGRPLFDLRLTHEDLVQAQVEFLRIAEELDVVNREIERLRPTAENGAIPKKTLLDRQYELQKLRAGQKAQRESLLLHGFSGNQVDEILETRSLRSNLTICVPDASTEKLPASDRASNPKSSPSRLFVVEEMRVESGRLVTAGDPLLSLADYSELHIEGNAFEQDGQLVADALREHWKITAIVENHTPSGTPVPNLAIVYLSDQIDSATRTLHFYLRLPNEKTRDEVADGHRFINWRFKPGQRTQLRVPVEKWPDRIVLPADAVVQDGAESFVFQENGDHLDRRPVQVEYRDLHAVVIAQDGSLFPGDV